MGSTFHLSAGYVIAALAAIAFMIVYPLALALFAHRRLGVSWRYFGYGALIFFLFQLISRVPVITAVAAVIAPQLKASVTLQVIWAGVSVITAALFEEVGRYIGYRWLMRREEKTWNKAVMYGLGHGGLESMVLVAGLAALSLLSLLVLSAINLNALPAAQRPAVMQQLQAVARLPGWFPLLGAWERLWTVPIQVAQSVLVLQVFRRGNIGWLWLAILAHAVVDGATVAAPALMKGGSVISKDLFTEGVVVVFGLIAIWIIFALRDRPETTAPPTAQSTPEAAPQTYGGS